MAKFGDFIVLMFKEVNPDKELIRIHIINIESEFNEHMLMSLVRRNLAIRNTFVATLMFSTFLLSLRCKIGKSSSKPLGKNPNPVTASEIFEMADSK